MISKKMIILLAFSLLGLLRFYPTNELEKNVTLLCTTSSMQTKWACFIWAIRVSLVVILSVYQLCLPDMVHSTMICALNIKYASVWVRFDLLYCCRSCWSVGVLSMSFSFYSFFMFVAFQLIVRLWECERNTVDGFQSFVFIHRDSMRDCDYFFLKRQTKGKGIKES